MSGEIMGGAVVTPEGVVPLTPEEAQAIADLAEQKRQEDLSAKIALARRLSERRDENVRAKRVVEQRWIESLRQYRGLGRNLAQSKQYVGDANDSTLQPPRIHATRKYTDRWEARLSDMLFPTQEQVWDLVPSSEAELSAEVKQMVFEKLLAQKAQEASMAQQDPSQPPQLERPSEQEIRDALQKEAERRAQNMRNVIKDQLEECKFVRSGRAMVRDACRIGTGLLMGPMTGLKKRRKYDHSLGEVQVTIEETITPEILPGNPWHFFPEMTQTIDKASGAFYLHLLTAHEVQELAQNPGFDKDQVRALLNTEPEIGEVGINIGQRNDHLNEFEPLKGRYAIWRYTGCLERKEVEVLGHCSCDEIDPLEPVPMIDLWYSQDFILKSKPYPIQQDYRVPYYLLAPFHADGTMFGSSLPDLCSNSQRVCDSALAMALHNMSVSSGPLVLMRAGAVTPADKRSDIRGPKQFWVDKDVDIDDVWRMEIVPNVADQCWDAFDRAMQLIEFEINSDQLTQDDQTEAVTTSSGIAMLLNTKSILQRHAAASADDDVITPVINSLTAWNMQHNPREDIKGDFSTIPKAQTVQLVKDVQAQQTLLLNQVTNSDPDYQTMVDKYEMYQSILPFFDVQGKDRFVLSREKWEQKQANQPPDPGLRIAEAQAAKAEADAQKAGVQAEQAAIPQQEGQPTGDPTKPLEIQTKFAIEQEKIQLEREKIAAEERIADKRLQAEILQAAARLQLDRDETLALLRKADLDRQMKGAIELAKNESYNREMDIKQTSPDRQGV